MTIKHTEFMNLTQGTKSLTEYLHALITCLAMLLNLLIQRPRNLLASRDGLGPNCPRTWLVTRVPPSMSLWVMCWPRGTPMLFMPHPRTARGPMRQVLRSPRIRRQASRPIARPMLWQGTGRHRRSRMWRQEFASPSQLLFLWLLQVK